MAAAGIRLEHGKVWRLAGPIILSNLTVPLLGAVDTAVVGHLPDPAALGAVGVGAMIFSFIYWAFGFLRMSTTGLVAQAWGREDSEESVAILWRALLLGGGIALVLIALQVPTIAAALWILDSSTDVERLAEAYFSIRIWSAPGALGVFVLLGWFLGQQDARTPLIIQILMNGINIILDIWFVMGLGWGVEGVAAATVIAEYAGLAVGLLFIARRGGFSTVPWGALLDRSAMATLISVNGDIFVRTLCLLAGISYFTVKSAEHGELVLAANTVLLNFLTFASHGLDAFAHAAEALVGGAVGKRQRDAFSAAVRTAFVWAGLTAGLATGIFLIADSAIIGLLTSIPEVVATAEEFVLWPVLLPLFSVWAFVYDGVFIGATRSRDLRNGMIVSVVIYVVILHLVEGPFGNHGLWFAMTAFMLLRGVVLAWYYPRILRSIG